jgi:membrane protein DedA with SNARE-associated domain
VKVDVSLTSLLGQAGAPVVEGVLLFLATFIHEDTAILGGGYLVHAHELTLAQALGILTAGVVVGDFGIYGLGMLAARVAPLRRFAHRWVDDGRRSWLESNMLTAVVACRVAPGILFPTFLTCGFFGMPFRPFAAGVIGTASLYVPAMLAMVMLVGGEAAGQWGPWGWGVAMLLVVAITLVRRRMKAAVAEPLTDSVLIGTHPGMPPLRRAQVRVSRAEGLPVIPYYTPNTLQWFWLSVRYGSLTLPTAANPNIEAGGLLGESKTACFAMAGPFARQWLARSVSSLRGHDDHPNADHEAALAAMAEAGLGFPAVVKPDIGWRGFGVRKVNDAAELAAYLGDYPKGACFQVQEYLPWAGEAAVFWLRRPGAEQGEIFSLTLRYYPFVVGDGRSTLRQLILACPRMRWKADELFAGNRGRLERVPGDGETERLAVVGSNRVAGLYIDGQRHATPALAARIEEICGDLPEFHFGRFDLRFEDIHGLEAGEGFRIVEINGAGAEAVHIWDPDVSVLEGYRVLFRQQALLFAIGDANRRRGFPPMTLRQMIACQRRQQGLLGRYPASG